MAVEEEHVHDLRPLHVAHHLVGRHVIAGGLALVQVDEVAAAAGIDEHALVDHHGVERADAVGVEAVVAVLVEVRGHGLGDLVQVAPRAHAAGFLTRPGHGGQQHPCQHGEDGDHDETADQ